MIYDRSHIGGIMLYPYTVCFFGHRYIDNHSEINEEIYKIAKRLIKEKEYVEFLVGRDGDFDLIVASAIRRAIKEFDYGNSCLIWILPYDKAEFENDRLIDVTSRSMFAEGFKCGMRLTIAGITDEDTTIDKQKL